MQASRRSVFKAELTFGPLTLKRGKTLFLHFIKPQFSNTIGIKDPQAFRQKQAHGKDRNREKTHLSRGGILINSSLVIITLHIFSLPCFGGDFSREISGTASAYTEHLEWQKSFQWNRKQAFQTYKRRHRNYLKQREARLRERLRRRDGSLMERQPSDLKKEWDAEQRAYQITRRKITRQYIRQRDRYRKKYKKTPKRTGHSREFVL